MIKISVVLCTYKRYDLAINCLSYMPRQSLERSKFEVIVVDNNPANKRVAHDWVALGANKCVFEENAGLSKARNKGIESSKGEIIAFIDDDAEPSEKWLEDLCFVFDNHNSALVVGGRVLAKYESGRPKWVTKKLEEYLSCIDWGEGTFPLTKFQWVVGANMAFRKRVFEEFGKFDVSLGRIGHATLLSNEETSLFDKLPESSIFYTDRAVVNHLIPSDRVTQHWFRKRAAWQGISDLLAGKIDPNGSRYYFEQFADPLPYVPAEFRNMKSLCYKCESGDAFERQVKMVYSFTVAMGLGLVDS